MTEPEYHNQIGEVPVGETYEGVTFDKGTIWKGDIVVWNDPDATFHSEAVIDSIFVGYVEKIYKRNIPELGTTIPVGRISIDNNLKAANGEEVYFDLDGASIKFINQFLRSEYEKYMNMQWKRNGKITAQGE